MKKMKVYIASPYTLGDVALNVKRQIDVADELIEYGFVPYVPLLCHFQHMIHPQPYGKWLELDLEWVEVCDILLRLDGKSSGADDEKAHAYKLGIPIAYSVEDCIKIRQSLSFSLPLAQ